MCARAGVASSPDLTLPFVCDTEDRLLSSSIYAEGVLRPQTLALIALMPIATRMGTVLFALAASLAAVTPAAAFHDCIQPKSQRRLPPALREQLLTTSPPPPGCSGGLCVGMHGGPHEGGPASYPVTDGKGGYTSVASTMTVPKMPEK